MSIVFRLVLLGPTSRVNVHNSAGPAVTVMGVTQSRTKISNANRDLIVGILLASELVLQKGQF